MADAPHPDSLIRTPDGRVVQFEIHRCLWSGDYPENSLPAVRECLRARVARAEIDLNILRDADFLVTHNAELDGVTTGSGLVSRTTRRQAQRLRLRWRGHATDHRPPLLSEVITAMRGERSPTLLELDIKDFAPWPWPRVEELARLVEPVKERVLFVGCPDWNLRRLARVDPSLPVGFNPSFYLDWASPGVTSKPLPGVRGAYGYLDAHPLARTRLGPTVDYLRDRLGDLIRIVPGARETHLRLETFERMLEDELTDAAELLHRAGVLLNVWTLDAETPNWRTRLARALCAGVDVIATNTPRALAAAYRAGAF